MDQTTQKKQLGTLYLIPVPIGEENPLTHLAPIVLSVLSTLDYFAVENKKSAFKFFSKVMTREHLDRVTIDIIDEHTKQIHVKELLTPLKNGFNMGIISEAGMPCIADPGSLIVQEAHNLRIKIIPLPGPSSLFLSLAASGFNGQQFTFHGYLPSDDQGRKSMLLKIEKVSRNTGATQLFIETPYRNDKMIDTMLNVLDSTTKISLCANLLQEDELVITETIESLKKNKPVIGKKPCMFLLSAR